MDAEILRKIASTTELKKSLYLLLSKKSSQIATRFKQILQMDLDKKWEMALVGLETYYSFHNIDDTKNNLRYVRGEGVGKDEKMYEINVSEKFYEISPINDYIQKILKERGADENSFFY